MLVVLVLLLPPAAVRSKASPGPLPGLDAFVSRVLKAYGVPGLALTVVKDGRVVVARGFGVRKLGDAERVNERTLFAIASNTKFFTAVALGLLAEEGKLAWDKPVIDYLPGFCLWDPYVTRELTVRDLLVHRSGLGLGAGDLLWWPPTTYDRREIVRRLRFLRPATSFRSAYAYDNVLYLAAGELVGAVSGKSWEEFVSDRILHPLAMRETTVRASETGKGGNEAWPHARLDGAVRPVAPFASDNTNPAGGIRSHAVDLGKWLLVCLGNGRLADGSRLYGEETARELTALVTPIPNRAPPPELDALKTPYRGYALGLSLHAYRGRPVLTHTGGMPGYLSKFTLLPEEGLGIAVLTNQESAEAFNALTWHIVDGFLKAPATDWIEAYRRVRAREDEKHAEALKKAAGSRVSGSAPSLPLEGYCGHFRDAWYGDVSIAMEGGRAVIRFSHTPSLVGDLEHWQHDTFIARWRDRELRADAYLTFALHPDGSIDRVKLAPVSAETDFSFDFQDLLLEPAGR